MNPSSTSTTQPLSLFLTENAWNRRNGETDFVTIWCLTRLWSPVFNPVGLSINKGSIVLSTRDCTRQRQTCCEVGTQSQESSGGFLYQVKMVWLPKAIGRDPKRSALQKRAFTRQGKPQVLKNGYCAIASFLWEVGVQFH